MAAFATTEWIDALARAAATAVVDPAWHVVVAQRIVDDPPVEWSVAVAGGKVRVTPGIDPEATLRLSSDRATAEAIHDGTLSAQRAFLDGALRIGGDVNELIADQAVLEAVADLLARVT